MIGERINPTGRKILAAEMKEGDYSRVVADAIAQVAAGAQMLDINAGIPLADEPAILAESIRRVQAVVDVPISIDSSIIEALASGLAAYQGRALVNSVTGETEVLERVLPLVKKYDAAVVAISNDETGISEDPNERFKVAKKISSKSNLIIKIGKKAFYKQLEMPLNKAYSYTSKIMTQNMMALDAKEGISAFLEKRKPKWKNK
jgi:5-methyltetrahydrofolate--homocysteine methyltransferase